MKLLWLAFFMTSSLSAATTINCNTGASSHSWAKIVIEDNKKEGTFQEGSNEPIAIQSENGIEFTGDNLLGVVRVSPSVYSQRSSRTHVGMTLSDNTHVLMNCLKSRR